MESVIVLGTVLNVFGYLLVAIFAAATVAYFNRDRVAAYLDSTIDWPHEEITVEELDAAAEALEEARAFADMVRISLLEQMAASAVCRPVWEAHPAPEEWRDATKLSGFDAAYRAWSARNGHERWKREPSPTLARLSPS